MNGIGQCNPVVPAKDKQVPYQLAALQNTVIEASNRLEVLVDLLAPIMASRPPQETGAKEAVGGGLCQVADSIATTQLSVNQLVRKINETINSLEV